MTAPEPTLNGGRRIAAIASGRSLKDDFSKERAANESKETSRDLPMPRHSSIGIKDDIQEHESERLNPGSSGGSASGAPGNKPKGPSNSA